MVELIATTPPVSTTECITGGSTPPLQESFKTQLFAGEDPVESTDSSFPISVAFGEGFYVTLVFLVLCSAILIFAMISENEIAKTISTAIIAIMGTIAASWFATRGQTGGGP